MSAALRKYGKRNENVIKVLKNSIINAFCNYCNTAILQYCNKQFIFGEYVIVLYYIYNIIQLN